MLPLCYSSPLLARGRESRACSGTRLESRIFSLSLINVEKKFRGFILHKMEPKLCSLSSFRESLKVGKRKNCHLFAVLGKNLESLGLLAQKSLGGSSATRNSDKYRPGQAAAKTTGGVGRRGRSASKSSLVTPAGGPDSPSQTKTLLGRLGSSKSVAKNGEAGAKRNGSASSGRNAAGSKENATGSRDGGQGTGGRGGTVKSRPISGSRPGSAVKAVKLKPRSGRISQSAKERRLRYQTVKQINR